MSLKTLIMPLTFLLLTASCKTSRQPQFEENELLILLKENVEPVDIISLDGIKILDQKRTSRSQNQWLLKVELSEKGLFDLKQALSKDGGVLEILANDNTPNENLSNQKSGKSKPTKN